MAKREPEHQDIPEPTPAVMSDPEPTMLEGSEKAAKDSDPIPESEWAPAPPERPYAEAVTDEHREHLAEFGMAPPKK